MQLSETDPEKARKLEVSKDLILNKCMDISIGGNWALVVELSVSNSGFFAFLI